LSSRFMNAASSKISRVSQRRGSAVSARGDDPTAPCDVSRADAEDARICASDVMSVSDFGKCCHTSLCRYAWEANISDNECLGNLVNC